MSANEKSTEVFVSYWYEHVSPTFCCVSSWMLKLGGGSWQKTVYRVVWRRIKCVGGNISKGQESGYEGGVPGEGYKLRIEILEKVLEIDFIKFPINFKWNSKKSVDPDPLKKLFKFFMYKYPAGF